MDGIHPNADSAQTINNHLLQLRNWRCLGLAFRKDGGGKIAGR